MKKTVYAIAIVVLILAGCSGGSSKETDEVTPAEIEQIESTATEMDSTISDIEETADELDELLDEL